MTSEQFVYWLKGWLDLQNPNKMTEKQVKELRTQVDAVILDKPVKTIANSITGVRWNIPYGT